MVLPQQVVSDNGHQFSADEFATFMKLNGIKHIRCAPYHPLLNGAAEQIVDIQESNDSHGREQNVFVTEIGYFCSLIELLRMPPPMWYYVSRSWNAECELDWIYWDLIWKEEYVSDKQSKNDQHAKRWELSIGQEVMGKNLWSRNVKWILGVVVERLGPLTW